MLFQRAISDRLLRGMLATVLLAGLSLLSVSESVAQTSHGSINIVSIEEDWELVIATPDTNSNSPQIRCVMSPGADIEGAHAAFTINHRTRPSYDPGGMQLQAWYGEEVQGSQSHPSSERLSHEGETIRWTQKMSLSEGTLTFEILKGTSTTWGAFGGQGYLKLSLGTDRTDLNSYLPRVSKDNSEVGFAANRVQGLVLRKIRAYTTEGLYAQSDDGETITIVEH